MKRYFWIGVGLCWFWFLVDSAAEYKWSEEASNWMMAGTAIAVIIVGYNLAKLIGWYRSPIRPKFMVTPVYIVETGIERVSFWPTCRITDVNVTHNYHNGSYQNTSLALFFDGKIQRFIMPTQDICKGVLDTIQSYDKEFRAAVSRGDLAYLYAHDDFIALRGRHGTKAGKLPDQLSLKVYASVAVVGLVTFIALGAYNDERPYKPAYRSSTPSQSYLPQPAARPAYIRPSSAPNGSPWPSGPGYVQGYKKLHADGLSTVTIDNTRNDSDVFGKLVYVGGNAEMNVRVFYIPAFSQFTMNKVRAGYYDVRYRDLDNGSISKSEQFEIQQIETYDGIQYSQFTMTLYKTVNGNMQTTQIPESQF